MANRYPLILDVNDSNKIKELPVGDNLTLQGSSIVQVQDITALGTINAADIRVNGNRLTAQTFTDLQETPNSYAGSEGYFLKVKADGTGIDYRPLSDIGNIQLDTLIVTQDILPSADGTGSVGTDSLPFDRVTATELKGNLLSLNNEVVFNATTGFLSYAAVQGAPSSLSEFTDDIGFLRTSELGGEFTNLFDNGATASLDIIGSVFADDSSVLVDAVSGVIRGNVNNNIVDTVAFFSQTATTSLLTTELISGPTSGELLISAGSSGIINVGTQSDIVNISNTITSMLKLNVLTVEPASPADGMVVVADGTTWNPTGSGTQVLVVYLGGEWKQIQTA